MADSGKFTFTSAIRSACAYIDLRSLRCEIYRKHIKKKGKKKGTKRQVMFIVIFLQQRGVFTDGGPGHLGRPRPCFQLKPTCWLAGGCWILLLLGT